MPNCTVCSKRSYSAYCLVHKPRKAIKTKVKPVPKRQRIKERGKHYTRWALAKEDWFEAHGSYHPCHYCGTGLKPGTITLDHKIPRSRAPELRYEDSNLVPCCFTCNGLKGSVDHDSYPHDCH